MNTNMALQFVNNNLGIMRKGLLTVLMSDCPQPSETEFAQLVEQLRKEL